MSKLIKSYIETPLGTFTAIADDTYLYELLLTAECSKEIKFGENDIILNLKKELNDYFSGKLYKFTIPIHQTGSEFEVLAWNALQEIHFGHTISYKKQSQNIGKEKSFRAVANANRRNKIMILIPCHRVVKSSGILGGYIGGIDKKRFLIEHEKRYNIFYERGSE